MSRTRPIRGALTGELVAHHWPVCVGLVLVCGIGNWLIGWKPFELPWLEFPVPGWTFTVAITVILSLPPLMAAFPELERTLSRARSTRVIRSAIVCLLITLAAIPTYLHEQSGAGRHLMLVYTGLLLAVGFVSVATIGDWAWVPPLAIGIMIMMLDHGLTMPVSAVLVNVPGYVAVAAPVVAGSVFCVTGPAEG